MKVDGLVQSYACPRSGASSHRRLHVIMKAGRLLAEISLSWVTTQRTGADTMESYGTRVALSVPTLALSGLATRGGEECAAMSDGLASAAAGQVTPPGSLQHTEEVAFTCVTATVTATY